VLVTVGSVVLFYALGITLMLRANLPFQALREEIVPEGWELTQSHGRLTEMFGSCPIGVFNVAPCLESHDRYAIPTGAYSAEELVKALEKSGIKVTEVECELPYAKRGDRFLICSAHGNKNDYYVGLGVGAYLDEHGYISDIIGHTWVRLPR